MSGAGLRGAPNSLENERLFNGIACALELMHKKTPQTAQMQSLRDSFISPAFFVESNDFVKERLGMLHLDAFYFSMIPSIARYVTEEHYGQRPKLNRLSLMADYLIQLFQGVHKERFYAVLLDGSGRKIDAVLISKGTTDSALFDMKLMLSEVVRRHARAVAFCHNHPRGTLKPSQEDVRCTLHAMKALMALGVPLLDHIVVAYHHAVSMRDTGMIPAALWLDQAPENRLVREWIDVDLLSDPEDG